VFVFSVVKLSFMEICYVGACNVKGGISGKAKEMKRTV
jgi:hypothetical protein